MTNLAVTSNNTYKTNTNYGMYSKPLYKNVLNRNARTSSVSNNFVNDKLNLKQDTVSFGARGYGEIFSLLSKVKRPGGKVGFSEPMMYLLYPLISAAKDKNMKIVQALASIPVKRGEKVRGISGLDILFIAPGIRGGKENVINEFSGYLSNVFSDRQNKNAKFFVTDFVNSINDDNKKLVNTLISSKKVNYGIDRITEIAEVANAKNSEEIFKLIGNEPAMTAYIDKLQDARFRKRMAIAEELRHRVPELDYDTSDYIAQITNRGNINQIVAELRKKKSPDFHSDVGDVFQRFK